jgi:hypothetical protein
LFQFLRSLHVHIIPEGSRLSHTPIESKPLPGTETKRMSNAQRCGIGFDFEKCRDGIRRPLR